MDSLTQIVVGIATVEAIAGKELKNKSFLVGALLGTLPDLDVWIGKLFNYETELAFHRAYTHSLLGILTMSPLFAWLAQKWNSSLAWFKWTYVIAATLATHVLIDLFTSWGVQLFYPLPTRYSIKSIFVVDIFYTLPWLIGLMLLYRKTSSQQRRSLLQKSFYISTAYLVFTLVIKCWVSYKVQQTIVEQNINAEEYIVKPTFSNFIVWNINIKTPSAYYLGDYSILDKQAPTFDTFPRINALPEALQNNSSVNKLKEVSENWYTITPYTDSTYAFNDLRFGWLINEKRQQQFVFAYELIPQGTAITVSPLAKTSKDGKSAFLKIWNRILQPK